MYFDCTYIYYICVYIYRYLYIYICYMSWSCFDIFPHFEGDSDFGSTLNGVPWILAGTPSWRSNSQRMSNRLAVWIRFIRFMFFTLRVFHSVANVDADWCWLHGLSHRNTDNVSIKVCLTWTGSTWFNMVQPISTNVNKLTTTFSSFFFIAFFIAYCSYLTALRHYALRLWQPHASTMSTLELTPFDARSIRYPRTSPEATPSDQSSISDFLIFLLSILRSSLSRTPSKRNSGGKRCKAKR